MRSIYSCRVGEGADDLLQLAVSRPHDALIAARGVLAARPGPFEASVAHQAAGIVLRDTGDVHAGVGELRRALRLARLARSPEREADVLASLGAALVHAGRTTAGLAAFDTCHPAFRRRSAGASAAPARRRCCGSSAGTGPPSKISAGLSASCSAPVTSSGRPARLMPAGSLTCTSGLPAAPAQTLRPPATCTRRPAKSLNSPTRFSIEHGPRSCPETCPPLCRSWTKPSSRFRALNLPTPELSRDRCYVLLAAGLTSDALAEADAAVRDIEQARGRSTIKAELLLTAASCALAADRPQACRRPGAGGLRAVPVAAQRLVAGSHEARARRGALRGRSSLGSAAARPRTPPPGACENSARARKPRHASSPGGSHWTWDIATSPLVISPRRPSAGDEAWPWLASAAGSAKRCGRRRRAIRGGC